MRLGPRLGVVLAVAAIAVEAGAEWPLPPDSPRESYADPANWPDDPGYGYAPGGEGGEWNLWSFVPAETLDFVRPDEIPLGAGAHVDRAWSLTLGHGSVVIAVLDSGIRWHERELVDKFQLNVRELPFPQDAEGTDLAAYDVDGDGVVSMLDYASDPRVGDWNGDGRADPRDLIRAFSDGVDDDGNGYVDDISGWDFFRGDNDPFDDTDFGHGTGEARDSTAATDNGIGGAGVCPECRPLMVRVGDSFVVEANDFARGVAFAVDSGASVIQEALGSVNMSPLARQAIDYAYANGVVVVASAADENSRHHNVPGTADHTLYVHAIVHDGARPQRSTTFLNFNNCTNYGGQLVLSTPGTGCSSEATGITSGIAGLLYSRAVEIGLDPPLHAEEVKQLLAATVDDVNVPESNPDHPFFDPTKYPSHPGWDQRFGYGRPNTRRALDWLEAERIPPRVHVESPGWFDVLYPDRTPEVTIEARIDCRSDAYEVFFEWAPGIEPRRDDWTELRRGVGPCGDVTMRFPWDVSRIVVDEPGEIENRRAVTVRVRVVAHYGEGATSAAGEPIPADVWGEHRKVFYVHRDERLLDAFPIRVGASMESSPKLVDLDGDGTREIVIGTAGGEVLALNDDGSPVDGWPVRVERLPFLDPDADPSHLGARAYSSGALDPDGARAAIGATVAIGDLDGDGTLEVVAATMEGSVWVWHEDGSVDPDWAWPVVLPRIASEQTDSLRVLDTGVLASPVLEDLDGDGDLEVIVGAFDANLWVFDHEGETRAGFPVVVQAPPAPEQPERLGRILTTPTVADFDGDGAKDILVGNNEELRGGLAGASFLVYADGNDHPGGPFHPNWPVVQTSLDLLPLVGEGQPSAGAAVDFDHDGASEALMVGTASPLFRLLSGVQRNPPYGEATYALELVTRRYGVLSNAEFDPPLFNAFATGAFGDLDQDGFVDAVHGGSSVTLALNLAGGSEATPFEHLIGAWSTEDGEPLPGFPRQVRDYQFLMNPVVADVSGDGYPEAITGSGGYYVEGWDALGRAPAGWPLFTGQWIIAAPAVGDIDGDGLLEVVAATRSGWLYAWDTEGCVDRCEERRGGPAVVAWESYHHDQRNTGNYDAPLDQGVLHRDDLAPLEAPERPQPDDDAGPDSGGERALRPVSGGCRCSTPGSPALLMSLSYLISRRNHRRSRRYRI